MRELIDLTEADMILQSSVEQMETEYVSLTQSLNRVLAEHINASCNIPPFNRSPLDGYAILASDTEKANKETPVKLMLVDTVPAGYTSERKVLPGTVVKVSTGAPIPEGATAVVKYEETKKDGETVTLFKKYSHNENIVFAGEDVSVGEEVIQKGIVIDSRAIGMLAALGHTRVKVFKQPRIAIFSTGDELVDAEKSLGPGKIRNSNSYALAAEISSLGGQPVIYGNIQDDLCATTEVLNKALSECNLILSTGGVSVGDYDVVKEAMVKAGFELLFWRVNLKPGTPAVAGVKEGKLAIGLSGNPGAALITFDLLAKPIIKKLKGQNSYKRKIVKGKLADSFPKSSKQMRLLRAQTSLLGGKPVARLTGSQSPGVMKSILYCNSYVVVNAGSGPLEPGAMVDIILTKEMEVLE
ncbi:molybdopterin molybdotransferase [Desulfitispora alkaliphila]|uniref:molybdopterin molybdotransferase MoeA n=1 Tax=Desulfitispora alkaliphila TaxID=622674 RepID=UPI003D2061A5